jgi:predicted MFS family arabinose efflux permease
MPTLAAFMFVLIAFNFIMSIWRTPVVALMPDLTPPPLRNQANGVINLMGGIGAILAFVVGGFLSDIWAPAPFFFSSGVMIAALVVLRVYVKEPPGEEAFEEHDEEGKEVEEVEPTDLERKQRRRSLLFLLFAIFFWFNGYNAVETLFSLYATESLGVTVGAAAMMLAFFSVTFVAVSIPAGFLANRIGRRNAIMIGLTGVMLIFPGLLLFKDANMVRAMLFIGGAFWAFVNINSLPMVLQLCSHKNIGKYTGYYYLFSFSASISAPILAGVLRDIVLDYGSVFVYAGVSFLIALSCMFFIRHGDLPKND